MALRFPKRDTPRQPYWRTTRLERWKTLARGALTKLQDSGPLEKLASALMLLVLLWLLVGCGTTLPPSVVTPKNPEPPPTTLSERSQTYSESASLLIQSWRQKLIGLIPKP